MTAKKIYNVSRLTDRRFISFAFLFYWASFFHQLSEAHLWFPTIHGQIYILTAIYGMFKPDSFRRFLLFSLVSAIKFFIDFPFLPNHLVFECIIHWSILFLLVGSFFLRHKSPFDEEAIFPRIAALIRWSMVTMYFFTFLAKLNADFLNPEYSCGAMMLRNIVNDYLFSYWRLKEPWAINGAIWGTVLLEFFLPALLLVPKTRNFGIILGLAFHFIMALIPNDAIISFSALSYVFLGLFLDDATVLKMYDLAENIVRKVKKVAGRKLIWQIVLAVFWYEMVYIHSNAPSNSMRAFYLWLIFAALVAGAYTVSMYLAHFAAPPGKVPKSNSALEFFRLRPPVLYLLLVPLFLNALFPYLGLKTQGCFTMFSNLRIAGEHPNHLLFPKSMRLFDQQLYKIIDSDHRLFQRYVGTTRLLPRFEFRRIANHQIKGDFTVTYELNGRIQTIRRVNGRTDNHELLRPLPWIMRKLIRFKPEEAGEHAECRW